MKLFKKLAAAALAAVLALSMVGCGAGSKGSTSTASELANVLVDMLGDESGIGAKHTGEMDNLAAALATSAGKVENAKEQKIKDLWLTRRSLQLPVLLRKTSRTRLILSAMLRTTNPRALLLPRKRNFYGWLSKSSGIVRMSASWLV